MDATNMSFISEENLDECFELDIRIDCTFDYEDENVSTVTDIRSARGCTR